MIRIDRTDLDALTRFYRGNLVNCLSGTKPALLVGTQSASGLNNLAMFSNVFHLGADPAMIGLVQRPITEFSHTYKNIVETNWLTINHINDALVARAHHTSAKFPEGVSEFSACGIEEELVAGIPAPFVKESHVRFAARFLREILIEENGTRLLLATIETVFLNDSLQQADGNISFSNNSTVAVVGLENYYSVTPFLKLPYAKP